MHCNGFKHPDDYNSVEKKDAIITKRVEKPQVEENIVTFKLPAASIQVYQFAAGN